MATETFLIQVRQTGARETSDAVARIGKSASETTNVLRFFRQALVALAAVRAVSNFVNLADAATRLDNRLRVSTKTAEQFARAQQFISDISRRTFTDIEANATVYGRLLRATDGLGFSTKELEQTMEALTQGVRIGGATSQEARNAMIQFSQALASGALRGDELRSVAEQLPAVANAIGKAFHLSGGELIAFAKANPGILKTREVVQALIAALPELTRQAALLKPTIENSFTVLRNAFIELIGDTNKTTGALYGVANAVIFLADHLGAIVSLVLALAGAWATLFALNVLANLKKAIELFIVYDRVTRAVIVSQTLLNIVSAANPYVLLAYAIAAVIAALIYFASTTETGRAAASALWTALKAVWDVLVGTATAIASFFIPTINVLSAAWNTLVAALMPLITWLGQVWDKFMALLPAYNLTTENTMYLAEIFKMLGLVLSTIVIGALAAFVAAIFLVTRALYALGLVSDATMTAIAKATVAFFETAGSLGAAALEGNKLKDEMDGVAAASDGAGDGMTKAELAARGLKDEQKVLADKIASAIAEAKEQKVISEAVARAMGTTTTQTKALSTATQEATKNIYLQNAGMGGMIISLDRADGSAKKAASSHKLLADIFTQVSSSASGAASSVNNLSNATASSASAANQAAGAYNQMAASANNAAVATERAARSNSSAGLIRGGGVPFGDPGYHATGSGGIGAGFASPLTAAQQYMAQRIGQLSSDALSKGLIDSSKASFFQALASATGVTNAVRGLGITTTPNLLTGTGLQGSFASVTSGNFSNASNGPAAGALNEALAALEKLLRQQTVTQTQSSDKIVQSNHGVAGAMFDLGTSVRSLDSSMSGLLQATYDSLDLARRNVSPFWTQGPVVRDQLDPAYQGLQGFARGGVMGMGAGGNAWSIGGSGGPDSKVVPVRLSPGEEAHFIPRGGRSGEGGGVTIHMPITVPIYANDVQSVRNSTAELENRITQSARRAARRAGLAG